MEALLVNSSSCCPENCSTHTMVCLSTQQTTLTPFKSARCRSSLKTRQSGERTCCFIHLLVHLLIDLFIHSFIRLFTCLLIHSFIHSLTYAWIRLFICSLIIHSFTSIDSFIHLFINYSLIHLLIDSFIYLFIHSLM